MRTSTVVIRVPGMQGAKGDKGDKGDPGIDGADGDLDLAELEDLLLAKENKSEKGVGNGYAGLDPNARIFTANLPAAVLGGLVYRGAWDADTGAPTIPPASADNRGYYYIVSVAGDTVVDGESEWDVGDWIISSGTAWERIRHSELLDITVGEAKPANLRIDTLFYALPFLDLDGRALGGWKWDGTFDFLPSSGAVEAIDSASYRYPSECRSYEGFDGHLHPAGGMVWTVSENGKAVKGYQRPVAASTDDAIVVQHKLPMLGIIGHGQSLSGPTGISKLRESASWMHFNFMFSDPNAAGQSGASPLIDDKTDLRPARDQNPLSAHYPATMIADAIVGYQIHDNLPTPGNFVYTAFEGGQNLSAFLADETDEDGIPVGITTQLDGDDVVEVQHYNRYNLLAGLSAGCRIVAAYNRTLKPIVTFYQGEAGGLDLGDGTGGEYPTNTYPEIDTPGAWRTPFEALIDDLTSEMQPIVAGYSTVGVNGEEVAFPDERPTCLLYQVNAQRSGPYATPHGVELDQFSLAAEHLVYSATGVANPGNTGNATITANPTTLQGVQRGVYTIRALIVVTEDSVYHQEGGFPEGATICGVYRPDGEQIGIIQIGQEASWGALVYTITQGGTPAVVGDEWTITVEKDMPTETEIISLVPMLHGRFSDWNIHVDGQTREMHGELAAIIINQYEQTGEPVEFLRMKSVIEHPDAALKYIVTVVNPTARPGSYYEDPFVGEPLSLTDGWVSVQAPVPNYGLGLESDNDAVITAVALGPLDNQFTITVNVEPTGAWVVTYGMTTVLDQDWSNVTNYVTGARRAYESKVYRARRNNLNKQPDVSPYDWELVPGFPACRGSICIPSGKTSWHRERHNDAIPDPFFPMARHRIAGPT